MTHFVTINVENVGVPHTWLTLTKPDGTTESYGYAPLTQNSPIGYGHVFSGEQAGNSDDLAQPGKGYSKTIPISEAQYNDIKNFVNQVSGNPGFYDFEGNNCTDFVRDALKAGVVPHPSGLGPHPMSLVPPTDRRGMEVPTGEQGLPGSLMDTEGWTSGFEEAEAAPNPCPLVLDLDGNGTHSLSINAGAYFDHNSDGFAEATGWVEGGDGLLVLDRDQDGKITSGRELFGSETLLQNGAFAADGFAALAEWDTNMDGQIDGSDPVWSDLRIWQDANADGLSAPAELRGLTSAAVGSIALSYGVGPGADENGNTQWLAGSFSRTDGAIGLVTDYRFASNPVRSIAVEMVTVLPEVVALPDIAGYGTVYDLHQAIVRDSTGSLRDLVVAFASESAPSPRETLFEQLLLKWTNAEAISPSSRGPHMDARRLGVLEAFMGRSFLAEDGSSNPNAQAAGLLNAAYESLYESLYAQFMGRLHLSDLYRKIYYTWDETNSRIVGDPTSITTSLGASILIDDGIALYGAAEFVRTARAFGALDSLNVSSLEENPHFALMLSTVFGRQYGSASADSLVGGHTTDIAIGWGGNDTISSLGGDDIVNSGGGDDSISAGAGDDFVLGGTGDDVIGGDEGSDALFGGDGNDVIDGGAGSDELYGGAGDDILGGPAAYADNTAWGGSGYIGNIYDGGEGNDTLRGTIRADLYRFSTGDGQDLIQDTSNPTTQGGPYVDRISFGTGINPLDVQVVRTGYNLVLNVGANGDRITVQDSFSGASFQIEEISFADGTIWTPAGYAALPNTIFGTTGDDSITGLAVVRNVIHGDDGNDILIGSSQADEFYGGAGNDVLGGAPSSADNTAWGGSTYVGNTYEGGVGNDTLRGTVGADVYRFSIGDGQDEIQDTSSPTAQGGPYVDRLIFGAGIAATDVQGVRTGNNLILNVGTNGDRITIQDSFLYATYQVEQIEFVDGTIWTPGTYANVPNGIYGTENADSLSGLAGMSNAIFGEGGDDTILGNNRADMFNGGAGNDVMGGGVGSSDWSAWFGGNHVGDTHVGGAGNDTLRGAIGPDVYRFHLGDGQDTIQENTQGNGSSANYQDRLILGDGITPADVIATRSGYHLVLDIGANGERVTVQDWYVNPAAPLINQVERIEFADGTVWTSGAFAALSNTIPGTEGADTLTGLANVSNTIRGEGGNDTLIGNNRSDTLYGGAGDDILGGAQGSSDWNAWNGSTYVGNTHNGGTGNDLLRGAFGADTYVFNAGDGQDTIADYQSNNGVVYTDRIAFGSGIAPADVTAARIGSNLILSIGTGGDQITINGWYDGWFNQIEQIEFANGTLWTSGAFAALPNTILGTEGADTLTGLANVSNTIRGEGGNDTLIGNNRSDTLYGGAGDDILGGAQGSGDWSAWYGNTYVGNTHNGGTGNDLLRGAFGADTYVFNAGDGQDTIADYQSNNGVVYTDRIAFGSGIPAADVTAARIGSNLVLTVGTGGDQITINGWYDGWFNQIERIEFADGTFVLNSNIYVGDGNANTLTGSANADLINGGAGNDTISGGGGGDLLSAGDGADLVLGQDGGDAIMGGAGNDNLSGGMGDDYLAGGADDDIVSGGEGNDVVQGGAGSDDVQGGIGNDVLTGDAGNDTLQGGDGNDFLAGGEGDDIIGTGDGYNIIAYNPGGGTDSVTSAASASNTLSFGGGLRYSDLSLSKNGNDLIINAGGTNDKVVLKDWYAGYDNVIDLQVMIDATNEFDAGSSDPLYNRKVQRFDFRGMVSQFDQALAQSPGLTSWAMTNALLQFHLSGSDDAALGGDLSYWYSKNGSLAGIGFASALQVFGGPTFGSDAQTLRAFNGLQEGLAKLG